MEGEQRSVRDKGNRSEHSGMERAWTAKGVEQWVEVGRQGR